MLAMRQRFGRFRHRAWLRWTAWRGRTVIQRLRCNGWTEDKPLESVKPDALTYSEGVSENDNERVEWQEWRLDGKIVKRGAHVHLKHSVTAKAIAALLR